MTSHMATQKARLIALRAQQADLIARLRAKRVAAGQCIVCGSETDRYRCANCGKIAAAWQRKWWKKKGTRHDE